MEFVELRKLAEGELMLCQDMKGGKEWKEGREMVAFWPAEMQCVSLIPLEKNERVDFEHRNVLAIHAEVSVGGKRCVVADQYRNCSLRNLLVEFGALPERLVRRYLR